MNNSLTCKIKTI